MPGGKARHYFFGENDATRTEKAPGKNDYHVDITLDVFDEDWKSECV